MMNQMNMNMSQMGMNDTLMTNFAMDNTAMKIKAIIEPYEKKIIELEKTIRQKDFEILVLKEKLNTYKQSQMNNNNPMGMNMGNQMGNQMINQMGNQMVNQMGMNMGNQMGMNMDNQMGMNIGNQMGMNMNNNQMGMNIGNDMNMNMMNQNIMNPMMNRMLTNDQFNWISLYEPNFNNHNLILNNENNSTNLINVIFVYKGKKYNEVCNFNDKTQIVVQKFCDKMGININNYKYIYCAKNLDLSLTVAEAGMSDMSTIYLIDFKGVHSNINKEQDEKKELDIENEHEQKINITFLTSKGGRKNLPVNTNISIEDLIKNYLKSICRENLIGDNKNIAYIHNASLINIKDKTKIKDFFKNDIIFSFMISLKNYY